MPVSSVWKYRKEEEVIACLEEAYNNAGYTHVYNWHKIDRAHEESVDIECVNFNEKLVIQAKIKPKKEDIEQLLKLSTINAHKRVYVFIEKPSAAFKVQMEKTNSLIDFIDASKLNDLLIKYRSTSYLRYLLLSSELVRDLSKCVFDIMSCRKIVPNELTLSNLESWWLLKDRAVKVHASLEYLDIFWKTTIYKIDQHNEKTYRDIVTSVLFSLKIISENSANDLCKLVDEIKDTCPNLLSRYTQLVLARSNWMDLMALKHRDYDENGTKELIENWIVPELKGFSEFLELSEYLKNLVYISEAIEDGVDYLLDDFLEANGVSSGRVR